MIREFEYLDGRRVSGMYMGDAPVSGVVTSSRTQYRTMIHYVDLDEPIEVYGATRHHVILEFKELVSVE